MTPDTIRPRREFQRYLLGYPEREDWQSLEMGWFANANEFEELLMAEEELIDDYIFGLLSAKDRVRFELYFLSSPERREKVANSRALREHAQAKKDETLRVFSFSHWCSNIFERKWLYVSSAACLLILFVAVMEYRERAVRTTSSNRASAVTGHLDQTVPAPNAQVSNGEPAPSDSPGNNSTQQHESSAHFVVSFTLLPGLSRSIGGEVLLKIPSGTQSAKFTLLTADAREGSLKEELLPPQNIAVWTDETVLALDQAKLGKVSLVIPAQLFRSDDYTIKLSQRDSLGKWETVARYAFRVIRTQ